jgi:hypothetical protein
MPGFGTQQARLAELPAGQQPGRRGQHRPVGGRQSRGLDLALEKGHLGRKIKISAFLARSERASKASQTDRRSTTR